jgi:hypothetical protein
MIGFVGHSQIVTANNYNTPKITVTIAYKMKTSSSACESLLGSDSYLVNTSTIELPSEVFYERPSEQVEFTNEVPFLTAGEPNRDHRLQGFHSCAMNALSRKPCVNSQATVSFQSAVMGMPLLIFAASAFQNDFRFCCYSGF